MNYFKPLIIILFVGLAACNNNNEQSKTDTTKKTIVTMDSSIVMKPLSGKVPLEKLSIKTKQFISKNYSGYNITGAAYDPLCAGGDAIDVAINKKGMANYSLIFLPDGTFIQQEEDVDIAKAPANVLKTIKEKYSAYKPANQIEQLILADKSVQYLLDISKGNTTREVILKEDGTVVCESKE